MATSPAPALARPAFRAPWTHGAHAYAQADTFAAFREGMKRKRVMQMVKMPNTGEAGAVKCAACEVPLRDKYAANPGGPLDCQDEQSTWKFYPATKTAVGMHYYCSWGATMNLIAAIKL